LVNYSRFTIESSVENLDDKMADRYDDLVHELSSIRHFLLYSQKVERDAIHATLEEMQQRVCTGFCTAGCTTGCKVGSNALKAYSHDIGYVDGFYAGREVGIREGMAAADASNAAVLKAAAETVAAEKAAAEKAKAEKDAAEERRAEVEKAHADLLRSINSKHWPRRRRRSPGTR
jgi:hypothetical protein